MKLRYIIPFVLLASISVIAQVGYSSNIGTSLSGSGGGGGGGVGAGACAAGQVMTAVNTGAPPTCVANVTPGTITTSTPFTFSQTWNNVATIFDAFHINVTKTAYAETSSLFQVTDTTNDSMYFSIQPDLGSPADGTGVFVFNNGTNAKANSKDFAIHSLSNAAAFADTTSTNTVAVFAAYLDAGPSWTNSATIRLGLDNLALNQNSIIKWTASDDFFNSIDTGLTRRGAGLVAVGNGTTGDFTGSFIGTVVQTKTIFTVATLPTCNGAAEGSHASVSDANTPVPLATVAGTGAVHISVYCNGTNWIVQ